MTKLPCTLHLGAPKTGSTAIQDALFFHLRDRRFQYAGGGEPNGSYAFSCLFQPLEAQRLAGLMGRGTAASHNIHERLTRRFERGLDRTRRRQAHLLLSAEWLWRQTAEVLSEVRQYFEDRGFAVQVRGYVRPWTGWLHSWFQHQVRYHGLRFVPTKPPELPFLEISQSCERFWSVFGREHVHLSLFDPARFEQGCVVRDFCRPLGLSVPAGFHLRSNESLSASALQLLYCRNQWGDRRMFSHGVLPPSFHRLQRRLQALKGPPLRLHPEVRERWLQPYRHQDAWIERELGFSLRDPKAARDDHAGICSEVDLWNIPTAALHWLAQAIGHSRLDGLAGEELAQAVARQVESLRNRRATLAELGWQAQQRAWKELVHWTAGC
ncbi:MAG: hypothetical protein ACK6D3_19850 [Planctomycetaceae bacterium]